MKKILLSLATVVMTTSGAMAAEASNPIVEKNVTFNFTTLPGATTSVQPLTLPYTMEKDPATLVIAESEATDYYSQRGLQLRAVKNYTTAGTTTFRLSAPNRKITKIVINSGELTSATCQGAAMVEGENADYTFNYTWVAPSDFSGSEVEFKLAVESNQWVTNLIVSYEETGSGLIIPNLSVKSDQVAVSIAETSYDLASNLVNPNNAPIEWSIQNGNVGTLNGSVIELKAAGTTTITATVNDAAFDPETISYELVVANEAFTAQQMGILAPNPGDKVKVGTELNFLVVSAVNGAYYETETSTDEEGNTTESEVRYYEAYAFCIDKNNNSPVLLLRNKATTNTTYRTDDLLPGNWTATNVSTPDLSVWGGMRTPDGRAFGWIPAFNEVSAIADLEEYRVVNLKNVTLENGVSTQKGEVAANLEDGTAIEMTALCNRTAALKPGIYDIIGAMVKNGNGTPVFYPTEYTLVEEFPETVDFPKKVEVSTDVEGLTLSQMYDPEEQQILVMVSGNATSDSLTVTFTTPEGWDGFYATNLSETGAVKPLRIVVDPEDTDSWTPDTAMSEMNMTKTNSLTFTLENGMNKFGGVLCPYKGNLVYTAGNIMIMGQVNADVISGVETFDVADADAKYYNLQGIEIENPSPGIYVKVLNGKAYKATVK